MSRGLTHKEVGRSIVSPSIGENPLVSIPRGSATGGYWETFSCWEPLRRSPGNSKKGNNIGMKSFQNFRSPRDSVGSVRTREVAMYSLWTMHDHRFKPASILNIGVGSAPELSIWKWILPTIPILAVDPRKLYPRLRRRHRRLQYVQAVVGEQSSSPTVFCQMCRSVQCKSQASHEAAGHWESVEGFAIDELVVRFDMKPPHFIWMDIDGSEVEALRGATNTLKDTPWLLVELVNWIPRHIRNILKILRQRGFVLEVLFSHDGLFRNEQYQKR